MSDPQPVTGRIIIGLQSTDAAAFERSHSPSWNEETEKRYMDQVRERAQQKAKEILSKAMDDAATLRKQAQAEGYKNGHEEARHAVSEEARRIGEFFTTLHKALAAEKQRVAREHQDQLFQLLCLALEKTLGTLLASDRATVLRNLFDEALAQLQTVEEVTLSVSPADEELARELIASTNSQNTLPPIRIKACRDIDPGGVRLECGSGMIDNTIASRFEQVQAVLHSFQDPS